MTLFTPKPPTADGNPPEYNAMKDLAERCAKAETELERVKIERDEAYVARDFADAALERVKKREAAMREVLTKCERTLKVWAFQNKWLKQENRGNEIWVKLTK